MFCTWGLEREFVLNQERKDARIDRMFCFEYQQRKDARIDRIGSKILYLMSYVYSEPGKEGEKDCQDRVWCVMKDSISGHVILETFSETSLRIGVHLASKHF